MSLETLYNNWVWKQPQKVNADTKTAVPPQQAKGEVAVDFLPNTYQAEVRNRAQGDKIVIQATDDGRTNGTFNQSALLRYTAKVGDNLLRLWRGKEVHKYDAQSPDTNKQYITSDSIRNTPGALYDTNP